MKRKSNNIFENDMNEYEYYEIYDNIYHNILMKMVEGDRIPIRLAKIQPTMYQQALNEFMKMGKIVRYPTKNINKWKNIIIRNTIYLDIITMFWGHTQNFDIDAFNDYVMDSDETGERVSNWNEAMEIIQERGYDDVLDVFLPKFSNGHDLISDYGLEPLQKIVFQLLQTNDPNEILILINKALNISHQRSDLSELFIEGGQMSLNKISGIDENIKNIIREEIFNFIHEEEYFDSTLPDNVKRHSNSYRGRDIIWYGDPNQMIVIHKDQVHGMWGNIYDSQKLQFVEDLIRNSEDYVEFECSYALGGVVDLQDIIEHQEANFQDRFTVDYDGHERPYSIGDDELDTYIGNEEYIDDNALLGWKELNEFYQNHRFDIARNRETKESLRQKFEQLKNSDEFMVFDEDDHDSFELFLEMEEQLANSVKNSDGDLGKFTVQLRDGHHRVMGAINAGEEYICVNLDKDDVVKYKDYINRVR